MIIGLIILLLLLATYCVLILLYKRGWHLQPYFSTPEHFTPSTFISIIIPARNEEKNIKACVESILQNDYPEGLYEIFVIDDHSTDGTFEIVKKMQLPHVICLKLKDYLNGEVLNSYKKRAIETGISQSKGELIITTDADCIAARNWLKTVAACFEKSHPAMIIGAVKFTDHGSMLSVFQSLDFMTLQGITAAAHRLKLGNMCNGANLAFSKKAFYEVGGYQDIDHLASGDDYLLLNKMHRHFPDKIAYLKSEAAVISTAPQLTWKAFFNQRIRWASKMGKYDDKAIVIVLMLVYIFNLSFLALLVLGFFDHYFWLLGGAMLIFKTTTELFYLNTIAAFFRKEKELFYFPFLQPIHIFYIIIAGFLGFFGKYDWKGRTVK